MRIQHALDAGALVIVVPTVNMLPRLSRLHLHPLAGAATEAAKRFDGSMWGGVPGGYRNTINDNMVLIIETLEGLNAEEGIAKVPGVTALFAASG